MKTFSCLQRFISFSHLSRMQDQCTEKHTLRLDAAECGLIFRETELDVIRMSPH